jgi:hypothetical protein
MKLGWYWRRLRRMSPSEIVGRTRDAIIRRVWRRQWRKPVAVPSPSQRGTPAGVVPLKHDDLPSIARERMLTAADQVLEGRWLVFGRPHPRLGIEPDWFVDAASGRSSPGEIYAFDLPYRDEARVGNIKYIWEPSRHNHLTLLAAAYAASGDERYAQRVAGHLQSWWRENPFMSGPHWISGIEIGIRLISWVWIRRLLNGWRDAPNLFENNPQFIEQLFRHQQWLATLPSRGSSANNHLVAETAGQFVASAAFPYFRESGRWRSESAETLRREAIAQTFPCGLNRELATEYQGLVLELLLAAAIEGELSGHSLGPTVWERIRAMTDAVAGFLDQGRSPRQGDGDDASGLLLDAPEYNRWNALLSTGEVLFGRLAWWPVAAERDVRTNIWTRAVQVPLLPMNRPAERPEIFPDAGHVYLRSDTNGKNVWCRCDHGPHGFLSIAAHAHADALAIELRIDGVDILADPGTYCYHGEPEWRGYFRSTRGHNTLELDGQDQSTSAGPFLWTDHAQSSLIEVSGLEGGAPVATWRARHTGYVARGGPEHHRSVALDRGTSGLTITDRIHHSRVKLVPARLTFHLGPSVDCQLASTTAKLTWRGGSGHIELPEGLTWSLHCGESDPPLGWYSEAFGKKSPANTLVGLGNVPDGTELVTRLRFD